MIKAPKIHAFLTTHRGDFDISSECEGAWSESDVAIALERTRILVAP